MVHFDHMVQLLDLISPCFQDNLIAVHKSFEVFLYFLELQMVKIGVYPFEIGVPVVQTEINYEEFRCFCVEKLVVFRDLRI